MKNENIISISEILKECKKRVGLIVVCAIVFAVLLGGVKYYMDSAAVNVEVEDEGTKAAPPIDVYEEADVAKIEKYVEFVRHHENMKKYLDESIYMNLDFSYIYSSNTQFQIKTDDSQNYVDVLYYLNDYVKLGGLVEDISDSYTDIEPIYLQEIIAFKSLLENSKDASSNIFTIRVYGRSLEESTNIMTVIEKQLIKFASENEYLDYELKIVEKNTGVLSSTDVSDDQTKYQSRLTDLATKMQSMKDQLTEQQLLTANAILAAEAVEDESDVESSASVGISKAFVLLGGFFGIIFGVCLVYALYYFDNTLKSESEIENKYKLQCVGATTDSQDFVSAKIYALCNKLGLKDVVLAVPSCVSEQLINSYTEKVSKYGVKVNVIADILTNTDAIIELSKNENVILMCKIRGTSYTEMNNMLQICEMQNINILGYIAVK